MEVIEAIKFRKSIRGYKPTPVPKEVLAEILEIATRAPSGMNTQPWEFTVLGGKVLDNFREVMQEQFLTGTESKPDFTDKLHTGVYKERQRELGISLYQLMGIARDDKEKRDQWMLQNLRGFDATNIIIISMDEEIDGPRALLGIGAVIQNIALVAVNFGLGTCIEGILLQYPEVVRRITGIPESKKLVMGIAIGYPDWDFPANKLQSTREPLTNIATWKGI